MLPPEINSPKSILSGGALVSFSLNYLPFIQRQQIGNRIPISDGSRKV